MTMAASLFALPKQICGSEGIYYVVCYPTGWRVMACRFDEEGETSHSDFWRHLGVSAVLARAWQSELDTAFDELEGDLRLLVYALPRGRVTKVRDKFRVYHGKDVMPFMRITRRMVEVEFGVEGKCRWVFDEHERCLSEEKEAIRELLKIREDWPAA